MEPKKVLIIDDTEDLRDAIIQIIDFKGYKGFAAANGVEGIEIALREHPDLILLDLIMPDMNGFDVLRSLRKDEWGKNANIVVLTAQELKDGIPEDIEIRPEDFLTKSQWGIENLGKMIEEKLNK